MPRRAFRVRGPASRLRESSNEYAVRGAAPDVLSTAPALLGPATLFSPTILQIVQLGVLGGAVVFAPTVQQRVGAPLLGGAILFAPEHIFITAIGRAQAREELFAIAAALDQMDSRARAIDELVQETS